MDAAVFLYSSFQLVCAALHQITLQNSFDLTHNRLWAQVREILVRNSAVM